MKYTTISLKSPILADWESLNDLVLRPATPQHWASRQYMIYTNVVFLYLGSLLNKTLRVDRDLVARQNDGSNSKRTYSCTTCWIETLNCFYLTLGKKPMF